MQLNRCSTQCIKPIPVPVFASSVCTAAVIWRCMWQLTGFHYCSLSISVLFSFFVFSLCSAGQPSFFCSAQGLLHLNEMGLRVNENFQVLLDIFSSSASCRALDREAALYIYFFLFHCISGRTSASFVNHLINHTVFSFTLFLCILFIEGMVVFSVCLDIVERRAACDVEWLKDSLSAKG